MIFYFDICIKIENHNLNNNLNDEEMIASYLMCDITSL